MKGRSTHGTEGALHSIPYCNNAAPRELGAKSSRHRITPPPKNAHQIPTTAGGIARNQSNLIWG